MNCKKSVIKYVVYSALTSFFLPVQAWIDTSGMEGFRLSVDYLGWKAQEDQLQYAIQVPQPLTIPPLDGSITNFNYVNQCFSFDSGVRLEAGYSWCDSWEAFISWTHFREDSCGSVKSNSETGLIAILFADPGLAGNIINFASSASSRWNLHFDTITADIGKHYDLCDTIGIDFFGGIAGARIHQRQNVFYADLNSNNGQPIQTATAIRCNNFSGVGPHAGIATVWSMCYNTALRSSLSAALLVGKFCGRSVNTFVTSERTLIIPLNKKRVRPWFDLALGLEWKPELCDCVDFNFHIDFEAQYLPEQWQAVANTLGGVVALIPSGGHLTTYGVTLGFDVLF